MAGVAGVLRADLKEKIDNSKILVVGAGGIGCEILKNLVMCGFKEIEIVSIFVIVSFNLQSVNSLNHSNVYSSILDRS